MSDRLLISLMNTMESVVKINNLTLDTKILLAIMYDLNVQLVVKCFLPNTRQNAYI